MLKHKDYDLKQIGEWPFVAKVTSIVFACLIFAGLIYASVFSKALSQVNLMKKREVELKANYVNMHKKIKQSESLKKQLHILENAYANKTQQLVFSSKSIVSKKITKFAETYNLQINAIDFQKKYLVGLLRVQPVEVVVQGGYQELISFLGAIKKDIQLVQFHFVRQQNKYLCRIKFVLFLRNNTHEKSS